MQPMARNTMFRSILELAEAHGVTRRKILSHIDLDASDALRPGALVPSFKLIDAVEFAALATGRRDFGLLLGAQNDHRSLGPVGVLAEHCRTVGEAIAEGSRFLHLHNAALHYSLESEGEWCLFRVRVRLRVPGRRISKHYVEAVLTMFVRFCRLVLEPKWKPIEVRVEHERMAMPGAYRVAFGGPVRFQQDVNAVVLAASDLERPLVTADHRIKRLVQRLLEEIEQDERENIAARVTALLRPLLAAGHASPSRVAALLSMAPRTLQRKLASEGTSFKDVLSDLRIDLAREHITRGTKLTDLASILGLSESSAVSRFLRKHLGKTSTTQRQQNTQKRGRGARQRGIIIAAIAHLLIDRIPILTAATGV